jgi:hypothetical protein|uniref:Uncharacterized protein n=1 Tax=Zea mays TaxID=4577 RepID=C0HFM2_MAIZE|nr:unknown [Zea mays]
MGPRWRAIPSLQVPRTRQKSQHRKYFRNVKRGQKGYLPPGYWSLEIPSCDCSRHRFDVAGGHGCDIDSVVSLVLIHASADQAVAVSERASSLVGARVG